MSERIGFAANLEPGQLIIKTLTSRQYHSSSEAPQLGSELGYWLCRFDPPFNFEVLAKFASPEAVDLFAQGLHEMIVHWPESDE